MRRKETHWTYITARVKPPIYHLSRDVIVGNPTSEEISTLNIDRYEKDLDALIEQGDQLLNAMQYECWPQKVTDHVEESLGDETEEFIKGLPSFKDEYQLWYSEATVLIRQLLPDRLTDFTHFYEKPKSRKKVTFESYTIEDYLVGLRVGSEFSPVVGPDAAVPRFRQQLNIVKSIEERFQSSLFEIRKLAQADLFDSELDAAKELVKNKFNRAGGVVAGVVLERHLKEVCANHGLTIRKKATQISELNDKLKAESVIDIPQWRSIQLLGDLRNLCAHDNQPGPTRQQADDLIAGVAKVTKTVF